jgi:hypothetical protein
MLKKIFFIGLLSFFNVMCDNSCNVDKSFKSYFDDAITSLETSFYGKKTPKKTQINHNNAIIYLEFVTNIKINNAAIGEYYSNEKAFKQSLKQWRKWYRLNKCIITEADVDSLYSKFLIKRQRKPDNLKFYKFPTDWRLLFSNEGWGITDFYSEPIHLDTITWK